MPRTPDATWLSVVKLLQQLPPDAQLKDAPVLALRGQLGALASCKTQSLPRATWKQLIRERKVCYLSQLWDCLRGESLVGTTKCC